MNILEILKSGEKVFVKDEVEGKKTSTLVDAVNKSFEDMSAAITEFADYAQSQLNGEVNHKIVMAKSLLNYYPNSQSIKLAYDEVSKEEGKMIAKYTAVKTTLLNNLSTLLKESQKEAVVSSYDLFDGDYKKCPEGHEVIILGAHNADIIQTMIETFNQELTVEGHFEEVQAKELTANYVNVQENVTMCKMRATELYGNKAGKLAKVEKAIEAMQSIGEQVVFFETYVKDMLLIGVKDKDIKVYQKAQEKQYIPLKKTLQKDLKINFVEICDIVADENAYAEVDLESDTPLEVKPVEPVEIADVETTTDEADTTTEA